MRLSQRPRTRLPQIASVTDAILASVLASVGDNLPFKQFESSDEEDLIYIDILTFDRPNH